MRKITVLLILSLTLQSCALVFTGVKDKVSIKAGTPENAKVYYNGSFIGEAPTSVKIPKKALKHNQATIKIESEGYVSQEVTFDRKLRVGAFVLDCLTGFIWLIPDYATGAIYKASPKKINYNLTIDENSESVKNHGLQVGDSVYFTNSTYKNRQAVVKIIYPSRAVLFFVEKKEKKSLFKKETEIIETEIEVEVPFVNISKINK